jgi:RND family efflux transporter MFP subunit
MNATRTCPLTLALLAALAGCDTGPARPRPEEADRLPRVETVTPQYLEREEKIELLATVEPLERARLCAQVQGEVKGLTAEIDIGRRITRNEPLLTLDIPAIKAEQANKHALLAQAKNQLDHAKQALEVAQRDVEEARAQLNRFRADLEYRELAFKRIQRLVQQQTLQPELREESEMQRNSARAAWEAARVTIKSKEARLEAAKVEVRVAQSRIKVTEADVKLADTRVEFATVRAPFDGIITRRWVHNGAVIRDPTMPLLTVIRTDLVRVVLDIPERYVPSVRAGQSWSPAGQANRVRIDIQGYHVEQPITRLASAVNNVTRLMRAEIHVKNDQQFRLRPGMTGTATLTLSNGKEKRLTVPSTALVRLGDEIRVFYLDGLTKDDPPRGNVKSTVVTLGLDDGQTVEVKSGLTGSEVVIARGNGVVREGETVLAVKARERKHE